jgi:hypothetical protein
MSFIYWGVFYAYFGHLILSSPTVIEVPVHRDVRFPSSRDHCKRPFAGDQLLNSPNPSPLSHRKGVNDSVIR